jgi:hypothetical protein
MAATTTTLLLATQGAAAAASAASALTQAGAIRSQGRLQEQIARANARFERTRAEQAREQGEFLSRQARRRGRVLTGRQRAAFAGQGVEVSTGSAADIQRQTFEMTALDQLTIQVNAQRRALGFESSATGLEFQGAQARRTAEFQARQTLVTGGLGLVRDVGFGAATFLNDPFFSESQRPPARPTQAASLPVPTQPIRFGGPPRSRR